MFYHILKKDLKHKRGINFILFLFMILATVFVASSVNNILVISNATDYCMDKGKVSDIYITTYEMPGESTLDGWLTGNSLVEKFSKNEAVILSTGNIVSFAGKNGTDYSLNGTAMIQKEWKDNMLVFDQAGNEVHLNSGEIGMQQAVLDKNDMSVGDTIRMKFNNTYKNFKITTVVMDPAFGGDFVGTTRYVISDSDFEDIKDAGMTVNYNYNIDTNDVTAFTKALNSQTFNIIVTIDREMFAFAYVMPMIAAGILIIVGVCLIIIAFLILRFTIVFTLQEDYKEIGIMKAIGIRNFMIKKIYLVKYFALITGASLLGCFLSIPISNFMISIVSKKMMMENAGVNFGINILCAAGVAVLVLIMCYLCMNKLRKFSAVEAIRSGQSGERFHRKSLVVLHKVKRMPAVFYMAINDILSNIKRYIVLLLTFIIGMIIIILPLNTVTSLTSTEMATNFLMDTKASFFIDGYTSEEDAAASLFTTSIDDKLKNIQNEFKQKGYNIDYNTLSFYALSFYVDKPEEAFKYMAIQPVNSDGSFIDMIDGKRPVNENEVVLSEQIMKKMNVKIGDTIYLKLADSNKKMIISGAYQNYMQMGESAYVSSALDLHSLRSSGCWMIQCYLKDQKMTPKLLDQMRDDFPGYSFYDLQGALSYQLGNTIGQVDNIKIMVVAVILVVNILITVLMMKIFVRGDEGQIAMMRSLGFSIRQIRLWLTIRMGIILLISVLLGILSSMYLNGIALRPIFGMMGATHMKIQVNPLEVYCIYPLILLAVISVSAYISSASVRHMKLMEINNAE
jgi:putative ABC transport system permease protein